VSSRARVVIFAALVAVCAVVGVIAVMSQADESDSQKVSATASSALGDARESGRSLVMFRELPGGKTKGLAQVAIAPASGPSGKHTLTALSCARVYFAGGRGICIARSKRLTSGYRAEIFDPTLKVDHTFELAGIPSRTRVSPDGKLGATTMFVAGHAYATPGSFSTQTTLIDLQTGDKIADLEDFTVTDKGKQVTAADVNYWGVTFASDGDTFYATLATGGKTYLIKGSIRGRTAQTLRENVECPSLSPDGKRIAFKKRTGSTDRPWRLTVLDLATMRETPLAEQRSVDDQAEWLDDGHVLYGAGGAVWSVPADGTGKPSRYLAGADSPASVRW
jgi:hypothetical protein